MHISYIFALVKTTFGKDICCNLQVATHDKSNHSVFSLLHKQSLMHRIDISKDVTKQLNS